MRLDTFSIVARWPRTGRIGGAVSTAMQAEGAICPFVQPGTGAVASQSWANPYLALDALALMTGAAGDAGSGPIGRRRAGSAPGRGG